MDAPSPPHPADQTLLSYGLGKLDDVTAEEVIKHLEACPDCRKRVAEMSADSFLGRVRDAQRPSVSSATGQSQAAGTVSYQGPPPSVPPPAETLPPGLADHPDYRIGKELGRGGMGVVYLAHNTLMGRDEVIKVMGRHILERPGVLDRFLREIRSVARLRHPNIVTAYSAIRLGESLVFAMEYVEGLDLSRLVKAKGPLPVAHACQFAYQAALGLQHAHEEGLVHRDIKPANLMLSRKGDKATVKVLDFGLAKAAREEKIDGGLTSTGQALGTPDFIAPEQIIDAPTADIRADIYSLGGTLYFLLTGRPPFQANSLYDIYQAHISRDADPLNLVRPEVPAELAALVAKMMAKDPSRRFQTPAEVAEALKPFFAKGGAAAPGARFDVSRSGSSDSRRAPVAPGVEPTAPSRRDEPSAASFDLVNASIRVEAPSRAAAVEAPTGEEPGVPPDRRRRLIAAAAAGSFVLLLGIVVIIVKWGRGSPSHPLAQAGEHPINPTRVTAPVAPPKADGGPADSVAARPPMPTEGPSNPAEMPLPPEPVAPSPSVQVGGLDYSRNLLVNPSCDEPLKDSKIPGWEVASGSWTASNAVPPFEGPSHFAATNGGPAVLQQFVDVGAFAKAIDRGQQEFRFEGVARSGTGHNPGSIRITVDFLDGSKSRRLEQFDSSIFKSGGVWRHVKDLRVTPKKARWIRVQLINEDDHNINNYFDSCSLRAVAPAPEAPAAFGVNLVENPGGEEENADSNVQSWVSVQGPWTTAPDDQLRAFEGRNVFRMSIDEYKPLSILQQVVDVRGFASSIDAGRQAFRFSARTRSVKWHAPTKISMGLEYLDATKDRVLGRSDVGPFDREEWTLAEIPDTIVPRSTRWIRIRVSRLLPHQADGFFDDVSLIAIEPSGTSTSRSEAGEGHSLASPGRDGARPSVLGRWTVRSVKIQDEDPKPEQLARLSECKAGAVYKFFEGKTCQVNGAMRKFIFDDRAMDLNIYTGDDKDALREERATHYDARFVDGTLVLITNFRENAEDKKCEFVLAPDDDQARASVTTQASVPQPEVGKVATTDPSPPEGEPAKSPADSPAALAETSVQPAPAPRPEPDPNADPAAWLAWKGLTKTRGYFTTRAEAEILARSEKIRPLIDKTARAFYRYAGALQSQWALAEAEAIRDGLDEDIKQANAIRSKMPNGSRASSQQNAEHAEATAMVNGLSLRREAASADVELCRSQQVPADRITSLLGEFDAARKELRKAADDLEPAFDRVKVDYKAFQDDPKVKAAIASVRLSAKSAVTLGPSKAFTDAIAAIRTALSNYAAEAARAKPPRKPAKPEGRAKGASRP